MKGRPQSTNIEDRRKEPKYSQLQLGLASRNFSGKGGGAKRKVVPVTDIGQERDRSTLPSVVKTPVGTVLKNGKRIYKYNRKAK